MKKARILVVVLFAIGITFTSCKKETTVSYNGETSETFVVNQSDWVNYMYTCKLSQSVDDFTVTKIKTVSGYPINQPDTMYSLTPDDYIVEGNNVTIFESDFEGDCEVDIFYEFTYTETE